MDGSDENVMAIEMAAKVKNGGEKRRTARQPSSENNDETAIATARENNKIKIKASKIEP